MGVQPLLRRLREVTRGGEAESRVAVFQAPGTFAVGSLLSPHLCLWLVDRLAAVRRLVAVRVRPARFRPAPAGAVRRAVVGAVPLVAAFCRAPKSRVAVRLRLRRFFLESFSVRSRSLTRSRQPRPSSRRKSLSARLAASKGLLKPAYRVRPGHLASLPPHGGDCSTRTARDRAITRCLSDCCRRRTVPGGTRTARPRGSCAGRRARSSREGSAAGACLR